MRFKLLFESKGRLRLRILQPKLSVQEADLLEVYTAGIPNVVSVGVNEITGSLTVRYRGEKDELLQALRCFRYEDHTQLLSLTEHSTRALNRQYQSKLLSMLFFKLVTTVFFPVRLGRAVIIIKSIPFILKGLKCLLKGELKVELLDGVAVGVSLARGDYSSAGNVGFLLSLGSLLEEWTHKRSVGDLAKHMSLGVDRVWVREGDTERLVPINTLAKDSLVVFRMGHIIALDGVVESGEAMVNQASMTGESLAVRRCEGHSVYAGTVIEEGELLVRISSRAGSSRYDRIVSIIEESEQLKSTAESKAEHLADKLVPYTFAGSVLAYLLTGNVTRALSVLMVDFSCALKLTMPLSVLTAMREASANHITVKGGRFMESVAAADTIVFDKTGTLTYAEPKVADIVVFDGNDEQEMLRMAACLEEHFPHSIATAVVKEAKKRQLQHEEMHSEIEYIVAHGISSIVADRKVVIGSHHFVFEDEGCIIADEDREKYDSLNDSCSHLYMAINKRLSAVINIYDPVRSEAADVIAALKKMGIKKTVMLTGDSYKTAKNIADSLGVDYFEAEVLPEDKAGFVERERADGATVIMVGDGINDSPALSAADVGIAINDGASIAKQIADVTISGESLYELVRLRLLSELLMKRISFNYRTVIGFNSALIAGGLAGVLSPTVSAFLHNMSTIMIGLNSMTGLLPKDESNPSLL